MDNQRFDQWTRAVFATKTRRALAAPASRRVLTIALVATPIAAFLAPAGREAAAARCKRLGKRCDRRWDRCCGGAKCRGRRCRCTRNTKACRNRCILATECCRTCPPDETCCIDKTGEETCVNLQSDFFNCGECGFQCPPAATCRLGFCTGIGG